MDDMDFLSNSTPTTSSVETNKVNTSSILPTHLVAQTVPESTSTSDTSSAVTQSIPAVKGILLKPVTSKGTTTLISVPISLTSALKSMTAQLTNRKSGNEKVCSMKEEITPVVKPVSKGVSVVGTIC